MQGALSSPLLENIDLHGASGVLVNITAGTDLSVNEFDIVGDKIRQIASDNATIIAGCIKEEDSNGELRVTLIATGFDEENSESSLASSQKSELPSSAPVYSSIPVETQPKDQVLPAQQIPTFVKTPSKLPNEDSEDSEGNYGDSLDIPAFLRQQAD